jgi:microcystin-dependent protein
MSIKVTTDGIHLLSNNGHINPIGSIICYAGQTNPPGWLFCNGSEVSKTTYPNLYAIISDYYGVSSNPDYFVLPNLKEKIPMGSSGETNFQLANIGGNKTVTLDTNQLPTHTHTGTTDSSGEHNHTASDSGHAHQYNDAYFAENFEQGQNRYGTSAGTDGDNDFVYRTPTPTTYTGHANITVGNNGSHTHTFTTNESGSGTPINILNPYLVLNYLIKY